VLYVVTIVAIFTLLLRFVGYFTIVVTRLFVDYVTLHVVYVEDFTHILSLPLLLRCPLRYAHVAFVTRFYVALHVAHLRWVLLFTFVCPFTYVCCCVRCYIICGTLCCCCCYVAVALYIYVAPVYVYVYAVLRRCLM